MAAHVFFNSGASDWARSRLIRNTGPEMLSAAGNLLSNAVRYTPAGGEIRLEWRMLPDGSGEIAVADTGPGIAREHLPRLTERFYRVDGSRSREHSLDEGHAVACVRGWRSSRSARPTVAVSPRRSSGPAETRSLSTSAAACKLPTA